LCAYTLRSHHQCEHERDEKPVTPLTYQ
jgi:hypothetical protein